MTRDKAKELVPILQAYSEGKIIQANSVEDNLGWKDLNDITLGIISNFTLNIWRLRIKSEPKLVPFTFEDNLLFRDKYVRYKGCFPLIKIISFSPKGVLLGSDAASYEYLFKENEFEDGTPCGKFVEE